MGSCSSIFRSCYARNRDNNNNDNNHNNNNNNNDIIRIKNDNNDHDHDHNNLVMKLDMIHKENAPPLFTMKGKEMYCRVISVYDGDTVDIVFYENDVPKHYKFRLYGVDTPEMKPPKNCENREEIIQSAIRAKEYLSGLILDKTVWIEFHNEEKYGRLMGTIYKNKSKLVNINRLLIQNGYGKEYYGGKKE
jgi:endonuclease YncB( thermonuclease family)